MGNLSFVWHRLKKQMKSKGSKPTAAKKRQSKVTSEALVDKHAESPNPIVSKVEAVAEPAASVSTTISTATNELSEEEAFEQEHGFNLNQMAIAVDFKMWSTVRDEMEVYLERPYYVSSTVKQYVYLDLLTFVTRIIRSEWKKDSAATSKLLKQKFKVMGMYILENLRKPKAPLEIEEKTRSQSWLSQIPEYEFGFEYGDGYLECQLFTVNYICAKYPKFKERMRFLNQHFDAAFDMVSDLTFKRLSAEYLGYRC